MDLDNDRLAILAVEGHLLISGGPGCGKTTIALLKAKAGVAELKVEQKVLFLSFSRAAVRQITDRMSGLLNRSVRQRLEVRTFHAFFMDVVKSHGRLRTGLPSAFITPDREHQLRADFDGDWTVETLRMAQEEGRYVFDLLAWTAATLFEEYPKLAALYSDTYPTVIVDEFQDTNEDQWRAIKALSHASTIICLADPDQRIFDYVPGVDELRIQHAMDFLNPRSFDLSKDNHRSPGNGLLAYANAVLNNDPTVPVPNDVTIGTYTWPSSVETRIHQYLIALRDYLQKKLDTEPTIAVLAPTNALVGRLSEAVSTDAEINGTVYPAVEHELHLDQDLASTAAYAVASIMEWPGLRHEDALLATLEAVCDYFRVKATKTSGAKSTVRTLERALTALKSNTTIRAKTATVLLKAQAEGIQLSGNPVQDWQLARARLTGSAELSELFAKARLVRLLKATDAIGRALIDTWDGNAYIDAAAVVRRVLANRMIDENRFEEAAHVSFMNMHKSKGKEFDGVIIAETKFGRDQLIDPSSSDSDIRARRRLLRVAITRARHHVVIVRHATQPPLTS
ncbi:UvrD-helicase domain-containing protein [Micromonospora tulbaghiae]|uniref:DNA helicase-2 / ATP-dependent DNA helicase PcrA n=1 Tax=Micromonospora tulbaghiae TaxID=479978 RepID=A0ABY0KQQ6_9ACTN|nr:UvrD-helicase domain-containing protein [Micromonospora tulbaghiae]SCF01104.1 DNA helicase-2 / ATP-dependent DNA helicase PcrA [Micromonospora tulbaghiae]